MRKCGSPISGSLSIALRGLVVEPLFAIHEVLHSTTKKKKQPPSKNFFEIKNWQKPIEIMPIGLFCKLDAIAFI